MTTEHDDLKLEGSLGTATAKPKYKQVRDHFQAEIKSGRLMPGQLLPSEAVLVKSLGISRHTVRQALAELESDGIVHRVPGSGTYVSTEQRRAARQKLDAFALISPLSREGAFPSLIYGFEEACAGRQHQTIVGNSGNDVGRQADLIVQMIERAVGGVALVPTTTPSTPAHQIRHLQKHQIPVVLCHRTIEGVSAPSVIFCGHDVGLKAGQKLVELGHRRIAMLFSHRYSMSEAYCDGLREAFVERGLNPAGVGLIEFGAGGLTQSGEATKAIQKTVGDLLARPDRPTAIFCGNAPDAEAVYLQAEDLGVKIPKDLSLMFVGSTWRHHGLAGRLSGVAIDEHALGVRAVELLYEMRSGKRPLDSDEQIIFPVTNLPGETIGPARSEGAIGL